MHVKNKKIIIMHARSIMHVLVRAHMHHPVLCHHAGWLDPQLARFDHCYRGGGQLSVWAAAGGYPSQQEDAVVAD